MMAWFNAYYNTFPDAKEINFDELSQLVRLRSGNATPEQVQLTLHMVNQLKNKPSDSSVQGIMADLVQLDFSGKAGSIISRYNNQEEVDLVYEIQMLAAQARRAMTDGIKAQWENRNIMEYLLEDSDNGGLPWTSFAPLHTSLKGLHKGDNVALCMPTDKGKTSLLLRFAVDMQSHAKTLYPDQPILYLVNEGTAARIITRAYQTALGLTKQQMIELGQDELLRRYVEVVGHPDAIRCVNIHGKNMAQIAGIIERHNPHMVITDMTGRIRATSNKSGGANDISQLEEVWNDFREQAVILEFAHMGTVQVSAEGFNQLYPPLSALQNSKTGIQTTLDLVIMGGALENPAMQQIRGISTPKNKLARSGQNSLNMFQAVFDASVNKWDTGA